MASLTFSHPGQDGSGMISELALADASHTKRWSRYGDMAAVGAVAVSILAAVFTMLDYQRSVYADMLRVGIKAEVAPLITRLDEMDKRFSARLDNVDRRLGDINGRIDETNRRLDITNQRLEGLAKDVGEINVRVGRLEGRIGK
ncbi:hypothetical protein [Cupriavidus pauculus]|uniref:hypothetical protein n=1 Tax=Cupriavidus pauculus TaxID=82633 RepID=UPI001EE26543|nr:hypothetical protein [Cupriavidus pauculus]GJG92958.1 hypothetical protein CBA19C6_00735 [Cupriavidus pauculus]